MSAESTGIDETYYPPFPWCLVNIHNLPKTKNVIVKGYIDTGSDGTIVTIDIDERLELHRQPIALAETMGIGGKPELRALYAAIFTVKGIEIVTAVDIRDDVEEVLIGRDILHHLILNIDWKKGTTDLKDP
ncbi:MAG: hypothetical protein AOA65_0227 [Candidatus Bathyarchaeota archaeon BA1]|nr:MAG: hypothetical protein AOA65_0227 [Candidatus Bathyarchaeota archaeon BA1]